MRVGSAGGASRMLAGSWPGTWWKSARTPGTLPGSCTITDEASEALNGGVASSVIVSSTVEGPVGRASATWTPLPAEAPFRDQSQALRIRPGSCVCDSLASTSRTSIPFWS